jgi:hypothetical protein
MYDIAEIKIILCIIEVSFAIGNTAEIFSRRGLLSWLCQVFFFYADADLNHFVSIFYYNHGLRYDDEYKEAYLIRFDEKLINSYDKAYE